MSERVAIVCDGAPPAIGPYSQGAKVDNWIYLSGQIALDKEGQQLVGEDAAAQTRQVLENITTILMSCGTSLGSVVKTTVYLADMNDFEAMNQVYGEYFSFNPPARSTVEVSRLPRDAKVEIEALVCITFKQEDQGLGGGSFI